MYYIFLELNVKNETFKQTIIIGKLLIRLSNDSLSFIFMIFFFQ